MAIWQYSFTVIPNESTFNGKIKPKFDDNGFFEDEIYWSWIPTEISFFDEIERILPKGKSWSQDLLIFGDESSNCFEVYSENRKVKSASFRIDFTSDYENTLRMLIEFINLNGLVIVDEEHNILDSNFLSIKQLIEQSNQFEKYNQLRTNN